MDATNAKTDVVRTGRAAGLTRLAIGLAQGILLFLLQRADESKAWPATQPLLYAPLLICALTAVHRPSPGPAGRPGAAADRPLCRPISTSPGSTGCSLVLSLGFTGAFWLLLFLAAALFKLIGVEAIDKLIKHECLRLPRHRP
jgi:hypothetical protein